MTILEAKRITRMNEWKQLIHERQQSGQSVRVLSRVGPVDKDKIWAEKTYSRPIFYPLALQKRWL